MPKIKTHILIKLSLKIKPLRITSTKKSKEVKKAVCQEK
jgi:hypothetical protein